MVFDLIDVGILENKNDAFDDCVSNAKLPGCPRGATDDNPARPEEHQNERVTHAEDEKSELVEELLTQHLDCFGVPDPHHESSGHDVAVKGAKLHTNIGIKGQELGCLEQSRQGKGGQHICPPTQEDGETAHNTLEIKSCCKCRAKPACHCCCVRRQRGGRVRGVDPRGRRRARGEDIHGDLSVCAYSIYVEKYRDKESS